MSQRKKMMNWLSFPPSFLLIAIILWLLSYFFAFGYSSICNQCGMIRGTIEWRLPRTDFTYFWNHKIMDTPLSTFLAEHDLIDEHEHEWIFEAGAGNGIRCAIGDGIPLRENTCSPAMVSFIRHLVKFGEEERAKQWRKIILHPRMARTMQVVFDDFPTEDISYGDFREWWEQTFAEEMEMYIERSVPDDFKAIAREASRSLDENR